MQGWEEQGGRTLPFSLASFYPRLVQWILRWICEHICAADWDVVTATLALIMPYTRCREVDIDSFLLDDFVQYPCLVEVDDRVRMGPTVSSRSQLV